MRTVTLELDPDRAASAAEALSDEGVRMRRGRERGTVVVGSFSGRGEYLVELDRRDCSCPDARHHGGPCKHLLAVLLAKGVAG